MSETTKDIGNAVMLKAVRISFPDVFTATQYDGKGPFNYRASFLIVPGSENDKKVQAEIARVAKEKWEKKAEAILSSIVGQSQKYCYVNGDTKAYDGYAGMMALSASRPAEAGAVLVLGKNKDVILTAADGKIYGGCYVNAKVQIWCQDNQYGKGVRSSLIAIQFASDGDSFGGSPPATSDGFETTEDDADEFV